MQVHVVISHLVEYLERRGEKAGLGFWSEQAMEACHHAFRVEWERSKVFWDHPNCGQKLFNTVTRFNAKIL